jgi:hypothetical protein
MDDNLKCIPANPDISGIGVRTAIYAQNLLCFAPVVAHLWDGKVSLEEMKGVKDQSIGMLAIAFAILISTIQATASVERQPITGFHAAVILDLSWMNNTSTWIWFLLYAHHLSKADERKERNGGKEKHQTCPLCRLEPGRKPIPAAWSAWIPVMLSSRACPRHDEARRFVSQSRPSQLNNPSIAAARTLSASFIALGTCSHGRPSSSLVPSTSRLWPELESGFGWTQSISAPRSPAIQHLPLSEAPRICYHTH